MRRGGCWRVWIILFESRRGVIVRWALERRRLVVGCASSLFSFSWGNLSGCVSSRLRAVGWLLRRHLPPLSPFRTVLVEGRLLLRYPISVNLYGSTLV
jgi:hypothetical protein